MTQRLYLADTYLFEASARILAQGRDDKGWYLLLDRTIFYPQGGGQPCDQGTITGDSFEVEAVRQVDDEVRHYYRLADALRPGSQPTVEAQLEGQPIICRLNKQRRLLNARYHTAGHLLSNVAEVLYPTLKAIKGHSFPGEAYVEFQSSRSDSSLSSGGSSLDTPDAETVNRMIRDIIAKGHKTTVFSIDQSSFEQKFYELPYQIPGNKIFRAMQIEGFSPIPCGGTHVATTAELGIVLVSKVKIKPGTVQLSYEVL